jgi:hypothetical protein
MKFSGKIHEFPSTILRLTAAIYMSYNPIKSSIKTRKFRILHFTSKSLQFAPRPETECNATQVRYTLLRIAPDVALRENSVSFLACEIEAAARPSLS